MKKFFLFLLISGSLPMYGQEATVVNFKTLDTLLKSSAPEIIVINFWATWCGPCIKELPHFEKLNAAADPGIKVVLVNLDYADKVEKVNSFLRIKKIKTPVLLLDEIDYNSWIEKVDKNWSGAIPATLVLNTATGKRNFVEKELSETDLQQLIKDTKTN